MHIYLAHSREFDYLNELYKPLRDDLYFKKFDLILPHETNESNHNRDFYKSIDLFIVECSYASTGLGIELGFAYDDNKKIYCIHKNNKKPSSSISAVTKNIYEYSDIDDMIKIIKEIIENNLNSAK